VAELAAAKKLPVDFLRREGFHDVPGGGISIVYKDVEGKQLFVRKRDVPGQPRFKQPAGVPLSPFGLQHLDPDKVNTSALFLVTGETDTATLLYANFLALGLPGDDTASCLKKEHLAGFDKLYICPDSDTGGKRFIEKMVKRLTELHYEGEAYVVALSGAKDVSEFYANDPDRFMEQFGEAVSGCNRLDFARPFQGNGYADKGTKRTKRARSAEAQPSKGDDDGRVPIEITTREDEVNAQATQSLQSDAGIYQR